MSATVRGARRDLRLVPQAPPQPVALVAFLVLASFAIGLASTWSPLAGIALPLGALFVGAVFRDLALGVVLFTILAFFQLIPGFEGSSLTLVKVAGFVLAAGWLVALVQRNAAIPFLPRDSLFLGLGAAAFWLWGAASALWAPDTGEVATYIWRVGQGVVLFLIVYSALREPRHLRWFAWTFAVGAFVAGGLGLVYGSNDGSDRLASFAIGDSNYLAAALVPGLVIEGFLFMTTRSPLLRTVLVGMGAVTAVSLFMTQSRGGIVGFGVAAIAGLLLSGPARLRVAVTFLLVAAAGLSYFAFAATPEARERITSFSAEASSGRSDLWTVAMQEFQAHPTTGVGAGNFVVAKAEFATESVNLTRLDRVVDDPVVVHNTYLEILAELGWVGLLLFSIVAVGALWLGLKGVRRLAAAGFDDTALLGRGIVIATIGMLAAYTFLSAQYEKNLWLLLAASAAISSIARRALAPAPDPGGLAATREAAGATRRPLLASGR